MRGSGAPGNIDRAEVRSPPCSSGPTAQALGSAAMAVTSALLALVIEAAFGYPPPLLRAIGHPVTWIGVMIGTLERRFNQAASARVRRSAGLAVLAIVVGIAAALAFAIERMLLLLPFGSFAVA